jgi:mannosyltransferase
VSGVARPSPVGADALVPAVPAGQVRRRRRIDPLLLAPGLVVAVLGGALLARRPGLWYDELFTAQVAPLPLSEIARAVVTGTGTASYLQDVPPSYNAPYYVVMHGWLAVTRLPVDEVGLRLPSLLAAVAAVAVLAHAVARLGGRPAGLVAGLLAATNPLVLEYAVEARGYGLAMLAVAVTALGLARWLDGGGLRLYAGGAVGAGLAHWFALPVLAGLALAALLLRRRAALPLVGATVLAALPAAGLVVLTQLNGIGSSAVGWIQDTGGAVPSLSLQAWSAGSAVLLGLTLVAVAAGLARGGRTAVVGACWVGVPLLAVSAAEPVRPVFVARYLLPALLGLAVLGAVGAVGAAGKVREAGAAGASRPGSRGWTARLGPGAVLSVLLVVALVGASLQATTPLADRGPREDGRGAVAFVAGAAAPGEQVAAVDRRAALALEHYAPEDAADVAAADERTSGRGEAGGPGLRDALVLPPADPVPADVVWLVRQSTGERVRPSDDDGLLRAGGMRVARSWVFSGTSSDLVVQRWER